MILTELLPNQNLSIGEPLEHISDSQFILILI